MPDISKINALAIGSVSKVDGLAKASILDINGVAVTPFTGLLDTYTGASAAYSVRQLKSGVTIAMRVRRDTAGGTGDNDEADVAYDTSLTNPTISLDSAVSNFSGTSNATNLGQFLNATGYTDADSLGVVADGFVDEWKDQSGNGLDAEQATFGSQPQIFDLLSPTDLITVNGKPTLFQGGLKSATITPLSQPNTAFAVNKLDTVKGSAIVDGTTSGNRNTVLYSGSPVQVGMFAGSTTVRNTAADTTQRLISVVFNGANSQIFRDGTSITTGNPGSNSIDGFSLGILANGTIYDCDNLQEFIFYNSDQDTAGNRTGIESNVNGFFGIY